MTSERWQQIDQLFHSALKCDSGDHAAFLAQACEGDESLRREVESLLMAHQQSASFIEEPANDIAAELLSGKETGLTAGMSVGQYKIVSLLSEGGMGEVYLAEDVRLGRQVAFKRLPAQFTMDADRVRRFEQEARAVSALNHPNIVTIHEIGESNSLHFITTEFINGQTLRRNLADGRISLDEVLDVACQIASALVAAHAAGIMHRDIKPENIMIRPDGYVKVLDFGLAKLVEQKDKSFLGLQESTVTQNQTAKGLILGTVNYMSPEQAKGERTDQRTDIFSLGVVIYEMLTGRTPFAGDSMSETFANLINQAPQPLSRHAGNVPDELQRIVAKLLRKDPDERYQTAKELLADLKYLSERLRSAGKLEKPIEAERENRATKQTARLKSAATNQMMGSKPKKRAVIAVGLILAIACAGLGYGLYRYLSHRPPGVAKEQPHFVFQRGQVTRLTSTGRVKACVVSPDGIRILDAVLATNPFSNNQKLQWTEDGSAIYYIALNDGVSNIWRQPIDGTAPVQVTAFETGRIFNFAYSADGKQLALSRGSFNSDVVLIKNSE